MGQKPIYLSSSPLLYNIDYNYSEKECEFYDKTYDPYRRFIGKGIYETYVICLDNGNS